MSAFADTAFGKDTAFASTAFDFGVAVSSGPQGGVSGYIFGKIHQGGRYGGGGYRKRKDEDLLQESFRLTEALGQNQDDEEAIMHLIMSLYD